MDKESGHFKYGKTILGPVLRAFCKKLAREIKRQRAGDGRVVVLFQARSGVRIKELLELLGTSTDLETSTLSVFDVSRLAVFKASLTKDFKFVSKLLIAEFKGHTWHLFLQALGLDIDDLCCSELENVELELAAFQEVYFSQSTLGRALRDFFQSQSIAFDRYLGRVTGGAGTVLLVDSGWRGTTQDVLERQFPEFNWCGLYFGCIDSSTRFVKLGLHFDIKRNISWGARCLTFVHNHLIESVLEPPIPSVVGYELVGNDARVVLEKFSPRADNAVDLIYNGVKEHFINSGGRPDDGKAQFLSSLSELYFSLVYFYSVAFPNKRQSMMLGSMLRESNMGKGIQSKVLCISNLDQGLSIKRRVQRSLWKPGQIAVEFPWPISWVLQLFYLIGFSLRKLH